MKRSETELPESFESLSGFQEFWDTHSTADYEMFMEPVEAELRLSPRKVYCPIAENLMVQIRSQARKQGVSAEALVNLWLKEKISA